MRGGVRKRGSTWTWYLDVHDPLTGKRRQRSKGGFRNKKECQQALNETLAALRAGTLVELSRLTLGGFLTEEWLPVVRPPKVRPSTWLSYHRNIERHILPALGHVPLQRLTAAQLTTFYRTLLDAGSGRGLAPKTVRNIHGALHTALKMRFAGATSPGTSPLRQTCPRLRPPKCMSGILSSFAPSLTTFGTTGYTPPGCCWPRLACGAGRWLASAGPTWTWREVASPLDGPG